MVKVSTMMFARWKHWYFNAISLENHDMDKIILQVLQRR